MKRNLLTVFAVITVITGILFPEIGRGALVKSGTGLIWSGFRPSDDACTYGYLIPSNMFAVTVLGYLEEIEQEIYQNQEIAEAAKTLKQEVHTAIETIGKTFTEEFGMVYAYETDGFGMYNLMDDANVPSLLAMDYLGYPQTEKLEQIPENFFQARQILSILKEQKQRESEVPTPRPITSGTLPWQSRG